MLPLNGNYVYVASQNDNLVSVIRTSDNFVTDTIYLGRYSDPYGIGVLPNGNYIYVADYAPNSYNVFVISSSNNTITDTITVGKAPYDIGVLPN